MAGDVGEHVFESDAAPAVIVTVREPASMPSSRGIAPVGRIDETILPTDAELVSTVMRLFDAAPWDPI